MNESTHNPIDSSILVVDDDPIVHHIVKNYLKEWEIESVHTGEEALKILKSHTILIAIVDIGLPGMDGISLVREMRKTRGIIQPIVLTASREMEHLIRAFEAGATDFLLKPVREKEIQDAVEHTAAKIARWRTTMKSLFV